MFEQVTQVNLGGVRVGGNVNPGGLTAQIFLAVDRSGGPTNNNVYMLCSVRPPTYSNGTDVMFARSTDGGASFSAPVRINDDATTNKWHWFGTFSVAPNGRLDAVWYDTRNAPDNLQSQLFYSYSTDAGVTWSPNVPVSTAFNPTEGWPQQNKIGDYITIVSDNTGGNVAYSATFNFNPNRGQHEEDVYYVRVFPTGGGTPTPTPTASPTPSATATATSTRNTDTDCHTYSYSQQPQQARPDPGLGRDICANTKIVPRHRRDHMRFNRLKTATLRESPAMTRSTTNFINVLSAIGLGFTCHGFGTNAGAATQAASERAARKIQHAAGGTSKNRDFAADDLAVRCLHQLSGERRWKWQQHPGRRSE